MYSRYIATCGQLFMEQTNDLAVQEETNAQVSFCNQAIGLDGDSWLRICMPSLLEMEGLKVMAPDQNAALSYALSLWSDWMRNDFAEIRALWYPAKSISLECRQSVTDETECDVENNIEHRIALEVNNAVNNLTPTERACIERSMALNAVARVRNYTEILEAAQGKVWRHLLSRGCL